ncbi:MAG: hypothetical protein HYZ17_02685 [Betaproteobacteria bacterium]|nr:hypothetical protein [Betaproteobacteria bacterium]
MFTIERRQFWALGAILALLMVVTRSHHFATLHFLPDASWAVFFLAGFFLSRVRVFFILLALAAGADAYAIGVGGVADFCVSVAYPFLIPAYGALWLGGRWLAQAGRFEPRFLAQAMFAAVLAAFICELISSGSFYFWSGVVTAPGWDGFVDALWRYFPRSLGNFALYLGLAAVLCGIAMLRRERAWITTAMRRR